MQKAESVHGVEDCKRLEEYCVWPNYATEMNMAMKFFKDNDCIYRSGSSFSVPLEVSNYNVH